MSDTKIPNSVNRYSDDDLAEFQAIIHEKLKVAKAQVDNLESQAMELNENLQTNGHDMDESNSLSDVEFLNKMITRQTKHIQDLEKALIRIKNKSYGICVHSQTLIDKRRLLAVPTTTKSLQSKKIIAQEEQKRQQPQTDKKTRKSTTSQSKQFSKVINKKTSEKKNAVPVLSEIDDQFEKDFNQLEIEEIETSIEKETAND